MSRKPIIGKCRLCGEIKKLTFEHVPPETTFNNYSVRILSGEEVIKKVAAPNNPPWDFSDTKGTIQQRGRGGYYLCGDCNSKTGQWYVPEYSKFVHIVHSALQEVKGKEFGALRIKMKGIKPLSIFKQIMTLFCDINEGMMGDNSLKDYLLNKTSTNFKRERYHLYMHIHSGSVERMNGIMVQFASGVGLITLSEISTYPVGFALYIDKPEAYNPEGVEITIFSQFNYDDEIELEIIIPKLESIIFFSGDYRTKEEIENAIQESKDNK